MATWSARLSEKTHSSSVSRAGQADSSAADATLTPLWVVVGLAMGPAVALGLSRFAYALLLPLMRAGLGWSFADAGAMNTANAAGYLVGALITAPLGRWIGNKRVFAIGLLLTALSVGATGLTSHFTLLLVLRTLTGVTGALAFVAGAGLTSAAAAGGSKSRAPTVLGVYFAGAGLGVMASALTIPPLLSAMGWRGGWLVLGGLSLLATIYGWSVLGHTPEPSHNASKARGGWSLKFMVCKLLSYCLYGAGYITYATFIVAYLRSNVGFNSYGITTFWSVLGLAAIVAAFAWGPVLGHLKGGWGTAATVAMVAVGAMLPLIWPTAAGAYLSAILFGGSFLAVVAAVTSFARRAAKPHAWTTAIAALTVAFGVGQCIGPLLSGTLSDGPSGICAGLWLSVGVLTLSVIVAAFQREPEAS